MLNSLSTGTTSPTKLFNSVVQWVILHVNSDFVL
jgi:hypothetical protein